MFIRARDSGGEQPFSIDAKNILDTASMCLAGSSYRCASDAIGIADITV